MALLAILTLAIVGGVAYTQFREGLLAAFTNCFCIVVAGMIAFQFWPVTAQELEPTLKDSFMNGMEDGLALVFSFCISLAALRFVATALAKRDLGISQKLNQAGGVVFGSIAGYLVAGFLICVLQTLPWHENFLGFHHDEPGFATRVIPSDQVWLKLMNRLHGGAFNPGEDQSKNLREFSKTFAKDRRYTGPN